MDPERILALILFGLLHWVLAIMLLNDLANRKKVLGGKKAPWAVGIIFIVFIGPLLYLLSHPSIFYGSDEE